MDSQVDPRFLRSKVAIMIAARALLLEHGPAAVTHAQVAERAGIGRATVYRHWPHTDQLLAEAMATVPLPFFEIPSTPTREWLHAELTEIAGQLKQADVRAVTTTLANAALWDSRMDARRERFAKVLADRLAATLLDALNRGEVELHVSPAEAAALLIGPIYYCSTIEHRPASHQLIDAALENLGNWRPSRP